MNPELPTGLVEVYIDEIEVLGAAAELPMPVFGEQDYPEEIRLKYRFLDLRREKLHNNIMLRGQVIDSIRRRMKEGGFFEFQTPILTASSPEGARDYLVPSRMHPGKFYALPQAPQQFKQLIMVAGFDRYFQIAPCFRDEDARADRSPGEFYQLDLEMSFVTQEDVFDAVEPVMRGVFEEFANGKSGDAEVSAHSLCGGDAKYGTDKPDLRNPIDDAGCERSVPRLGLQDFRQHSRQRSGKARCGRSRRRSGGNRAFCDRMNSWAQGEGQPGLGYIFWREGEEGGAGPLAKNIGPERTKQIADQLGLERRRCLLLRRRQAEGFRQIRRARAHQSRRGARPDRQGSLRFLLDRRFPDVRVERGREEDRLLAQSVLDAEHGGRGIPRARCQGRRQDPRRSRRSSTTSSATASNCRPARSEIIAPR